LYGVYRGYVQDAICADWGKSAHGDAHVDILCDLSRQLPFDAGVFDTVLLADVLEHIPEPLLLLQEVARVLRPGGRLVMGVPFLYGLHEQPYDFFRYTEFGLKYLIGRVHMRVISLESVGGLVEVIGNLAAKAVIRTPLIGSGLARAVQWSCALIVQLPLVGRLALRTAASYPLAYVVVAERPS
jgi:SAM-dependent methyltransferase